MEKYGILENGILKYAPRNFKTKDSLILNFNKNVDLMIKYGYKKVIDIKPSYDVSIQRIVSNGYKENVNSIIILYSVVDIEKKVTLEDRIKELENNQLDIINILSDEINK